MTAVDEFPIHHRVTLAELLHGETIKYAIDADAEQCRALAEYLEIPAVRKLSARISIWAEAGRRFILEGTVDAELTQSCVVTLEPVETQVTTPIRRVFLDEPVNDDAPEIDPFDDDTPDLVTDGGIDVGAVLCEHIALEMESYPRHPDAPDEEMSRMQGEDERAAKADNPFAVLAKLRDLEK